MTELTLDVYTSPMRDISTGGQFSPTTSTLLTGPTEAVLVDTQYMEGDVAELATSWASRSRPPCPPATTHRRKRSAGVRRAGRDNPGAQALADGPGAFSVSASSSP